LDEHQTFAKKALLYIAHSQPPKAKLQQKNYTCRS